jgi:hypothetical protein
MKSKLLFILLFAFTIGAYAQDSVTVNSALQFQTIEGWGHGGGILGGTYVAHGMLDSTIAYPVNFQLLDYLVEDLGLTGSRTWEVGPRTDGTGNDNGDCDIIDWTKFQSNDLAYSDAQYLMHYKNHILAEGMQPNFYSSTYYASGATIAKPWVLNHPGERAQQIWASALYMKNTYGININYAVIFNEPSGTETPTIIADDIKALGPRFIANGLSTKSQYAEAVSPSYDWTNYITPVQNDSDLWPFVGRLSYHNYGTADPYRTNIRDFGLTKGLTTAQTEMGNPTFDDLYNDLTLGGVSYWEVAYSSSNTLVPVSGNTSFTPSATYFRLRQVLHYVRPGATRIGATTNNPSLHVLSFSKNGEVTTVIDNTAATARTIYLTGLPQGTYGLSQASVGVNAFTEFGVRTVGAAGTLNVLVNGGSVVTTLYPYSGTNHAPTIMTWKSNPGYLLLPASSATLSVTANDAELDPLTYLWSVVNYPAGATVALATPNGANTSVAGLTVAGTYIFNIDVRDGINTSSKKVYLLVYATNPSPVMGSAGFRINAPYGLVFSNPGDTTHANIELPTASVILQVGISDLANSNFTNRGLWTLVQQPSGANVIISATTYIYVSIRATVTGMTVPGDYIFQVNITNPGHPDLTKQIICTVHPASLPPVITSLTSNPASITLPMNTVQLTGITSDPENDLLRHWWVVKSVPSGARPVFDHQGLAVSNVSGLTIDGTYIFTLRTFDDLHMVTKDITVIVNKAVIGIENNSTNKEGIVIYPNPVSNELNVQLPADEKIAGLFISNTLGQVVAAEKITNDNSGAAKLSLKSLPAGIYFLTVETKLKSTTMKIVKE